MGKAYSGIISILKLGIIKNPKTWSSGPNEDPAAAGVQR